MHTRIKKIQKCNYKEIILNQRHKDYIFYIGYKYKIANNIKKWYPSNYFCAMVLAKNMFL